MTGPEKRLMCWCITFLLAPISTEALARPVTVCIANAIISPAKSDHRKWDGIGKIDGDEMQRASAAFAAAIGGINPVVGAVAAVAMPAASFAEAPDAIARIKVLQDGNSQSYLLPQINNSAAPDWAAVACDIHIEASRQVRIRISLEDADSDAIDSIGTVELSIDDLKEAMRQKAVYLADTRSQGTGLIWGIGLSVTAD